jgi:hypothetical protein
VVYCLTNPNGFFCLSHLGIFCTLRSLDTSLLMWFWSPFLWERASLVMMSVTVSISRSRWRLLLRIYQGAWTIHFGPCIIIVNEAIGINGCTRYRHPPLVTRLIDKLAVTCPISNKCCGWTAKQIVCIQKTDIACILRLCVIFMSRCCLFRLIVHEHDANGPWSLSVCYCPYWPRNESFLSA